MIKVSIEVNRGAACFRVSVRAKSVRRALEITGAGRPGWSLRVVAPLGDGLLFKRKPVSEKIVGAKAA